MRVLYADSYDSRKYTDENLLYKSGLLEPTELNRSLVYLYGKDSDMFPLMATTIGQGFTTSVTPKLLNDTQYTWNTMGRMKHTSPVVRLRYSSDTKPGLNNQPFQVVFRDSWLTHQHGVTSPDQTYKCRVMSTGEQIGENEWVYTLQLTGSDPTAYISLDNFAVGKYWVMTVPTIAASKSDGNASNTMAPGKVTNQFGFHRFTKNIAGNIANKVTPIEFPKEGGGTTTMWSRSSTRWHTSSCSRAIREVRIIRFPSAPQPSLAPPASLRMRPNGRWEFCSWINLWIRASRSVRP